MKGLRRRRSLVDLFLLVAVVISVLGSGANAFDSDELILQDDDEFVGAGVRGAGRAKTASRDPEAPLPPIRRRPDLDSSSDSRSVQFSLDQAFGNSVFSPAGTFTARLKTWNHGGQTLTKLRFSRNALTDDEKKEFERLLKEDGLYTIRLPSNVLNPPGREYVVSSVRARCIPRESLDEHFVIHTDGVNILSVNYGPAGACQYPRLLKYPGKWSFNSYTVLKNSEQAPRTPTFAEEILAADNELGEGVKPPEKSFWSKYWMYLIPLGLIVMNAITQAMNMPEEQGGGQSGSQNQQAVAQRAGGAAVRRR